ncbi:hypothetical protein BD309DRAFT_972621 [Dichomitus squalens]|nr:hypothetical protein BD309DRAFT_972621 [Dichomitus squalens]
MSNQTLTFKHSGKRDDSCCLLNPYFSYRGCGLPSDNIMRLDGSGGCNSLRRGPSKFEDLAGTPRARRGQVCIDRAQKVIIAQSVHTICITYCGATPATASMRIEAAVREETTSCLRSSTTVAPSQPFRVRNASPRLAWSPFLVGCADTCCIQSCRVLLRLDLLQRLGLLRWI